MPTLSGHVALTSIKPPPSTFYLNAADQNEPVISKKRDRTSRLVTFGATNSSSVIERRGAANSPSLAGHINACARPDVGGKRAAACA